MFDWLFKQKDGAQKQVLDFIGAALRERFGEGVKRDGLVFTFPLGGTLESRWNVRNVVEAAPRDKNWRVGVKQLVERIASQADESRATAAAAGSVTIERDKLKFVVVRADSAAAGSGAAMTKLCPGVSGLLAMPAGGKGGRVLREDDVAALGVAAEVLFAEAVVRAFEGRDPTSVLQPTGGQDVIHTNPEPDVVAGLLAWPEFFDRFAASRRVRKEDLRVLVVAPTRIMVAVEDGQDVMQSFRHIAKVAAEVEEDPLPGIILRWLDGAWVDADPSRRN